MYTLDGARPHTANRTQTWLDNNHTGRWWRKGDWPGSSPDLSPIEDTAIHHLDALDHVLFKRVLATESRRIRWIMATLTWEK